MTTSDFRILGDDIQVVEVTLGSNQSARAEVGAMLYMEDGIQMQTSVHGGLFGGLKRMFTGESFFITSFLNRSSVNRKVAFAAPYPGKIIPIDLSIFGGKFICQKDAFLCSEPTVEVAVTFTKRIGT